VVLSEGQSHSLERLQMGVDAYKERGEEEGEEEVFVEGVEESVCGFFG